MNKPQSENKTIDEVKNEAADNYAATIQSISERFFTALAFTRGFDAAIALSEKRAAGLVEALEFIAKIDTSAEALDFMWLVDWRNSRKQLASNALNKYKSEG